MYQCCKLDVMEDLVKKFLRNERENFGVQHPETMGCIDVVVMTLYCFMLLSEISGRGGC